MTNNLTKHFKGKKVIVTGHTGFKGSWLTMWLKQLGANVVGLSLDIPSRPSHYESAYISNQIEDHIIDIRDGVALKNLICQVQPDFIFHLAAQALVRTSYSDPIDTIATNAFGSANVLEALRTLSNKIVAVMITSDKAYDNEEWVWGYRETDRLGGRDPYSASKGMAELAIRAYVDSFFKLSDNLVRVGICRAGNVIGGGDWAVDRIVPDCMRAWSEKEVVEIRSPQSTRPWQHVLEPLRGYLSLAANLSISEKHHGNAYNFGPPAHQNNSVSELIEEMSRHWDQVHWNDTSQNKKILHEAGLLKLNCDKALFDLQWQPALTFEDTVRMTVEWYKNFYTNNNESMFEFTMSQIGEYTDLANACGVNWTTDD
jgi:CDP-glucose 4,6-dehydratase